MHRQHAKLIASGNKRQDLYFLLEIDKGMEIAMSALHKCQAGLRI
jgi:hypothetical protein